MTYANPLSHNFEIYGDTPSSSMIDAELSLKTVEGTTLCTTNISIVATACFAEREPLGADEITNQYRKACAALCTIVSQNLTNEVAIRPYGILHKSISAMGFIRSLDAIPVLAAVEEALWLRISHELYPEGLEYELYCAAQTNDLRAARLMRSFPWRRLTEEDMKEP